MSKSTKFINKTYANIGNVTITFDDGSIVTHNINSVDTGDDHDSSVGTWFDENSSRTPVTISLLDGDWTIADLPAKATYPDGTVGNLTDNEWHNGQEIYVLYMNGQ